MSEEAIQMGKNTRKFNVKIEGQDEPLTVASATCGQTDAYLEEQDAAKEEMDQKVRLKRLIANTYKFIVDCLNNAGGEIWTVERLKAELDKQQIDALLDLAMEKSGLERPKVETPPQV